MEKKRVAFYTLGCKVNQYETNGMIQKFIDAGYTIVDFSDVADISKSLELINEYTNRDYSFIK